MVGAGGERYGDRWKPASAGHPGRLGVRPRPPGDTGKSMGALFS